MHPQTQFRHSILRATRWLFWLCLLLSDSATAAPPIVVLYPEASEPYRTVFNEMLEGIEQRLGAARVRRYALPERWDQDTLNRWLADSAAGAVITLGRVATQAYEHTALPWPQVIGALDASPQTRPRAAGISLAVDPELLFATLQRLAPAIRRVYVVYNPSRDRWIVDRARAATARHRLTLLAREAASLRDAANQFLALLRAAKPSEDAIWLLFDDQVVDTGTILPVIIEQSWQQRLLVFSNNLAHAKLGVLFALFPDNRALGEKLAEMAERLAADPAARPGIEPLRTIKRALNLRVADHLDLALDRALERQFDLLLGRP
ncbi:MAG: hypothetical protein U1F68_13125 [Gammaproteobacteria bacterium]